MHTPEYEENDILRSYNFPTNLRNHYMGFSWFSINSWCSFFSVQRKSIRTLFRVLSISRYCPGHTKKYFVDNSILAVHNLYFSSNLYFTFRALSSNTPKPISNSNELKRYISTRTDSFLFCLNLNIQIIKKNKPYISLRTWNRFRIICSTAGLLDKGMLIYWNDAKFKNFMKSSLLQSQKFSKLTEWNIVNYNIFEVETTKFNHHS